MKPNHTISKPLLAFAGIVALSIITALATPHYVDVNGTNATPPFLDWSTAATNIQDAVDAALDGDEVVVTDGVYTSGGRAVFGLMMNRVAVTRPLSVRSANGPQLTIIQGYQMPGATIGDGAIRCVYLTNGASLSGFTLTNGATRGWPGDYDRELSGGGVWCESDAAVVSNCVVADNCAFESGGGAYGGTLIRCTLTNNWAISYSWWDGSGGGGACDATLNNCTLAGNSADGYGGGHIGRRSTAARLRATRVTLAVGRLGGQWTTVR